MSINGGADVGLGNAVLSFRNVEGAYTAFGKGGFNRKVRVNLNAPKNM